MVKETRLRVVSLFALVVLVVFGVIGKSMAQDQQSGSGLSISPTRTEMNIEPGQSEKLEINVKNVTSGAIVAKPVINDFEADGTTGEPKFYKESDQRNSASIAGFVTGLADVPLEPGADADLTYTVTIPQDAAPGAYYGAITFRAVPANASNEASNGGQVALTANVSTLVLIEVPGNITEKIQVKKVAAYLDGKSRALFMTPPNKSGVTIENQGNSFAKPFGAVNVTNIFGKQVYSYELNATNPRGNILPNSSRTFIDDLRNVGTPGRYTITANISYGRGGEIIVSKATFWYLPLWTLLVFIGLIVGLVALGFYLYRRHGKKKLNSRRGR